MVVFAYSGVPFVRKHAPWGYTRYASYKDWLRDDFHFRCVYCLEREMWYPTYHDAFGVDHLMPKSVGKFKRLTNVYENLAYACNRCNSRKGTELLLDPRKNAFGLHLRVNNDGTIDGLTPEGQELILVLGLDEPEITETRQRYIALYEEYHNPAMPKTAYLLSEYHFRFRFPTDLPDLKKKRPKGNGKPLGIRQCSFEKNRGVPQRKVYF